MRKQTILVVGGAGFIGSHVNKQLNLSGYETLVFDNFSTGDRRAVTHGTVIEGDLANCEDLRAVFQDNAIDAVMHFAASIDVGESVIHPEKYYRNNVLNTLNLLNAMREHGVSRLIFSSSAAIFGYPQENPISEDHPKNPMNPYGETKLIVERILRDFDRAYGIKSCSLRYFNAAGGDPEGEIKNYKVAESNLIPVVLRSVKEGKNPVTIFGNDYSTTDGTCIRDYIHIWDLGAAHIAAMERLFSLGVSSCYNLGNGQGFSVAEVIKTVEDVTKKSVKVCQGNRRVGDPPALFADAKKARQELNWNPQYPQIDKMIDHAWKALCH